MPPPAARPRARILVETLEPRILYSADLAVVAGAVGGAGLTQELRLQTSTNNTNTAATATEIAFVDLGVPDAGTLLSGLQAQRAQGRLIEIVAFTHAEDGLARISQTLAERQAEGVRFDAVHVFSHGSAGALQLGSATLDADSLLRRAGEIAGWGGALGVQADLMLYGCGVAGGAGVDGLFLIEALAALTGADVAASDDPTGSAVLGGDWLLEQNTGQIEAGVALDAAAQQAWIATLSSEIPVNITTTGNQQTNGGTRGSQQTVTMDAVGNYTVVWTSGGQDGGGKGVYVRRFAFDGTPLTGEILVNSTTAKDQENARIVGDATGKFAVVWTSQDQDGTTASVYFRRFAADGTALTGEIRANATDSGDQLNAVIAMNASNGDVVVAWEGDGADGQSVFFRRFSQDGIALDSVDQLVIAPGTPSGEHDPAVAMNASGQFAVAWTAGDHVYARLFTSAGVASGSQIQMDTNISGGIGSLPSIAIDAAGNFIGVYRKEVSNVGLWVCTQAPWFGSTIEVRQSIASGDATSGSIGIGADGSAVVVYQMTGDGDKRGVYARKLSTAKAVDGAAFLVNETTVNDQLFASVAAHDANRFVVAWSGDGADDKDGVFARSFAPANTAPLITTNGGTSTAAVSVAENTTAVTTVGASDPDWPIQTVLYAIAGGADQAKFSINNVTGALRFTAAPDFEQPGDASGDNVYEVVVQSSDGLPGATQTLSVTVTDVADQVVAVDDTATTVYQTAVTVDVRANDRIGTGAALTVLDLVQPAHGTAAISSGQIVYTPDAGFVGTDTLQYRVIDGSEGLADYWALDETPTAVTTNPTSVVGVHGNALQFDGVDDRYGLSGVTYTSEFTLSYWFKLASNSGTGYQYLYAHGTMGSQSTLNTFFIEDLIVGTNNVLRTVLFDGNDTVTVAGQAALDISATGLADNQWHQYTLTTKTGAGSVVYIDGIQRASSSIQGGDAIAPGGTAYLGASNTLDSARFLTGALDDVQLYNRTTSAAAAATMASGPGDIGTVTVTVTPLNTQTPVIHSDGGGNVGTPTVAENTTAVTTVTATDADVGGPALVYAIVGGADQALLTIDSTSGTVTFRNAPDAEDPVDVDRDNVYVIDVQASDGVHVDTQTLQIVIADVNEHLVSLVTDADATLDEVDENAAIGTSVGLTAFATDADIDASNNTIVYTLDDTDGGRFAIDTGTGVVTVAGLLNAESAASHRIIVRATSSDSSSQTQTYVVSVRDLNEVGVAIPSDADTAEDSVSESAAIDTRVGIAAVAIDGDISNSTVSYTLTVDGNGYFKIDNNTGIVTVARALDAETGLSQGVTVQARSTDGSVSDVSFTITVQDVNESLISPITDADGAAQTLQEDAAVGTAVGFRAQATDGDATNSTVTYTLTDDAGGRFEIDNNTGTVTVARALDAETAVAHTVAVQARSADGSVSDVSFTITVQDVNEALISPITDVDGAAQTLQEDAAVGTAVGFRAQATDGDATNSTVTYTLTDDAGGRFEIDNNTGTVTVARALDAETAVAHTVAVQARSADGSVSDVSFTITVQDVNEFTVTTPIDVATAINTVQNIDTVGATVGLTASSGDADLNLNQITYTLTDNAGGRFAIDAGTGVVTLARSVTADAGTMQQLVVQAASTDGSVATRIFAVNITPANLFAPVIGSDGGGATAALTVPENTTAVTTVTATDADAAPGPLIYTLVGGADQALFTLDANSGVLRFVALPDAEALRDAGADNVQEILVQVSDGVRTDTQALTITVADVNESVISALRDTDTAANTVQENAAIGTTMGVQVLATDGDATQSTVTYSLDTSSGGLFAVNASTGVLTVAGLLDAETARMHTVLVRATSADGSTTTLAVSLAVQDVNEYGVTPGTDNDPQANRVREDDPVGTVVGITAWAQDGDVTNHDVSYALTDDAGGRFSIEANSGVVTIARALDAEFAQIHSLIVRALSSDGSAQLLTVTVAVQDVNEWPIGPITDTDTASEHVAETMAIGTRIGFIAHAHDSDVTNSTVTYALLDNAGGLFAIDANTGAITVAAALDAEMAQQHTLRVQATSSDRSQSTHSLTVAVTDVDEFDLVAMDDAEIAPNSVAEDAVVGTVVGLQARADDADVTNNLVTYRLDNDAGGRFTMDAHTGVITVAGRLNAEANLQHTITVRATSADGSVWVQDFTVDVTDVNEFDVAYLADTDARPDAVLENAAIGTAVGVQGRAKDDDVTTNTVTYTLDDSAGGRFAVDASTGVVMLARSVQEEGVATRDIVLRATSVDGSTVAVAFTLAITAVNDATPVITSDGGGAMATLVVQEGQTAVTQVQAQDADLPAETLRYTLEGGADAAWFTLDPVSGTLRFTAASDAEAPLDQGADNVYDLTVQVSDGLHTAAQTLRIDVQPRNDTAPVITSDGGGSTALRHVAENTLDITQVRASDADLPADTLTYAVAGGADAALFTVDAATGVLRWRAAPDYEMPRDAGADGRYDVIVSASDGMHRVSQALVIAVDNVDEAPRLDANTLAILEGGMARPVLVASDVDTPAERLVYTVQHGMGGRFEQVAAPGMAITRFTQAEADAGAIRFVADGGEAAPVYTLALADDTSTLAAQAAVVRFVSVNDAPVVAAADLGTVEEDTARIITTAESLAVTTDPESDALTVSALRLTAGEGTLTDLGQGRWRFDPAADWHGTVALAGTVSDGQATVALVASLQVRAVNDAPRIASGGDGGAAVLALDRAENSVAVTTVVGVDVDADVPLRYAVVGGADAAHFQIDAATGALSFRQAPDREQPTDANSDHRYDVTVEVSDGALVAQQALQVTVTNVDEAPVVIRNVMLLTDGTVTVVLRTSDPDTPATVLTYRVDAVGGGHFERVGVPGKAVGVFTQAELDAAQVVWVAQAGSTSVSYTLRVSDGLSEVLIGAPTVEHQSAEVAVTATELALVEMSLDDAAAAPSAGATASTTTPAAVGDSTRRTEAASEALLPTTGEVGLDPGQTGQPEQAVVSRASRSVDVVATATRSVAARGGSAPVAPADRVDSALDLPSESTDAPRRFVTDLDLLNVYTGTALAEQLDQLRQEVGEAQQAGMVSLASTALISTGVSVGYVIWLVRGGVLMTSLMSVVPAWAGMDPLPVLAEMRRADGEGAGADGDGGDDGGDDDPIEKLFSKARRLLVRPAATAPAPAPDLPETPA